MKKNALWMIVGNGGYALSQAVSMIILNKYLGIDAVGVFSLALALTAPIMLFTNFGLRNLWITDVSCTYNFNQFITIRRYLSFIGLILCSIVAFFYDVTFDNFLVILVVALSKCVENSADLCYAHWHKCQVQRRIAISLISRGCAGCLGIWLGAIIFNDILKSVCLYSFFWLFAHCVHDLYSLRRIRGGERVKLTLNSVTKILKLGFPLAVGLLLININLNLPRLVLEKLTGLEELGVYSALFFFVQTGSVFVNSIGQVALPKLAKLYVLGDVRGHVHLAKKLAGGILIFSVTGAAFFYLAGEFILDLLFGDFVASYNNVLILMFILSPAQYVTSLLGHVISSTKRNYSIMNSQIVIIFFGLGVSYLCIHFFGISGAVWAGFISSVAAVVMYLFSYRKIMKEKVC